MSIQRSTHKINHLGLVAEMCNELELTNTIDTLLPPDKRQIVSTGNIVKAMILNMLDIGQVPLFLMPDFFKSLPLDRFFYEGLEAHQLNDSAIGRSLDRIHDKLETIFMAISSIAVKKFKRFTSPLLHGDTTSMTVHGDYTKNVNMDHVIKITFGKSKDGRNDLKQFMISLVTNNRIPVFISVLSGNTSDKTHFRELVKKYGEQILEMFDAEKYFVFDSEFYTKPTLKETNPKIIWITRVPEKITQAKKLVESKKIKWIESTLEGYKYSIHTSNYGGVKDQQWMLVFSEKAFKREKATFLRQIDKLEKKIQNQLWHLSNEFFDTEKEAIDSAKKIEEKWKYHKIGSFEIITEQKKNGGGRGRPKKNAKLINKYRIKAQCILRKDKFDKKLNSKGRFILASNRKFEADELLINYKQQHKVERGFRFVKDSLFFTDGIFLKNEERIMSLAMILGLALMVYNLSELKMREAFKIKEEVFVSGYRKDTGNPTIRHVFQVFDGLHLSSIKKYDRIIFEEIPNLERKHNQVLRLMGEKYLRMYETKGEDPYALLDKVLDDKIK